MKNIKDLNCIGFYKDIKILGKAIMNMNNIEIARAYYAAMVAKNFDEMAKYLHPDVQLLSPFGKTIGKQAILDSARKSTPLSISIRASFGSQDQVMLVYDWEFNEPIGMLRAAALITFKDGLIVNNELFFDTSSFKR
jgi:hypothetical protein